MERQRPRKWTQTTFEKPTFQSHSNFDDSGIQTDVIQALERRIPNHFLVIALIQQLCSLYIEDTEKCKETFQVICEQLARMKILPTFALHEDFKVVREKYIAAFHNVLLTAAGTNDTIVKELPVKLGGHPLIARCPSVSSQLLQAQKQLEYNTTRYKEEFQELERLGKGGFGSVYKVKNKLDGSEYAVKKVHLSEKDLSNCLKVLREVKVLAQLRHPNVVGYQSAWLEFVNNENSISTGIQRISTHPGRLVDLHDNQSTPSAYHRADSQESDGSHIIFQTSDTSDNSARRHEPVTSPPTSPVISFVKDGMLSPCSNSVLSVQSRLGTIQRSASDANLERFTNSKSYKHSHLHIPKNKINNGFTYSTKGSDSSVSGDSVNGRGFGIVLFIQMELCDMTLSEWLRERNKQVSKNGGQVNKRDNMDIFKQIVVGVQYIHSQELIHRDIKPSNIFLHRIKRPDDSYEYHVKIGDFGLARTNLFQSDAPNGSEFTSMVEPISPLFSPTGSSPSFQSSSSQTRGVGTCTYASPEQLHNNDYSSKVDIYSLGIVLYEFFQPFNTVMEKHKCLKNLRQGVVQQEFKDLWPEQTDLILRMMAKDPELRPTASDIVSMDSNSEKNKCFAEMSVKLEAEQKENESLQERIEKLELELRRREEELRRKDEELRRKDEELRRKDELIIKLQSEKMIYVEKSHFK